MEVGEKKGYGISSVCSRISLSQALVLCLCILPASVRTQCEKKPVIFIFGDSNSDTGGASAVNGMTFGLPFGRAFFHELNGRLSDGRLMIDFFCESLNASYLSPYLESLGSNFTNGANFAIGGAGTLPRFKAFSLDVQVRQFLRFRQRSLLLSSKGYASQLSEEEFKNALYIIDIGQNDLSAAVTQHLSYEQLIQNIANFTTEIKLAVLDIYKSGGKNFWIHGTGPLGCLPQKLATTPPRNATTDYDPHGCLVPLNNAAKEFNGQLRTLCEELRTEKTDATIVYVDVYSIKYNIIANAAKYGFEKPLMACCGYGGPPYRYNPNFLCGGSRATACDPGQRYVSWDGVHYTEAANSIFAASILSTNFSTPPLNLNFFCNA